METNLKRFLEAPGKQIAWYITGGVVTVLMAAVIFCNLLLIVSNIREPNQMPSMFGVRPAIVLSGSMSPTFEAGDVILLKKTKEPDGLEVGDVACYLYSGKATTHRVIERFEAEGKTRYIMKGDYNNVEDRLAVDPEQIQGVWTGGRIPHLGRLLMFLQSTMGMFLFLICPLAGVLSWDILKRKREERLRREAWEREESAAYEEPENGSVLGRELRRISGLRRKPADGRSAGTENDEKYRRLEAELEAYRRREESRSVREDAEYRGRLEEAKSLRGSAETQYCQKRGRAAGKYRSDGRFPGELDEEFAYYAGQDESLDYLEELEEAALHYRKMKESLSRYRRMEAIMTRCRRLEEELARYEELADRLEAYELRREPGEVRAACTREPGARRPETPGDGLAGSPGRSGRTLKEAAKMRDGVSNQRADTRLPVDHIDRPSRSEKPE